jgi:hypothetical protein
MPTARKMVCAEFESIMAYADGWNAHSAACRSYQRKDGA